MNSSIKRSYKNRLLIAAFTFILVAGGCQSLEQEQAEKSALNIVLIVADDLGYGDLSSYGATRIQTPELDALAGGGMRFTNAYVSSSICSPSRYSILTGRYSWRTRLKFGVLKYYDKPLIEEGTTTIASMLQEQGYYTACVGKWHLGMDWPLNDSAPANPDKTVFNSWEANLHRYIDLDAPIKNGPLERGFDYFYGMAGSNNMQPYAFIENDRMVMSPSLPEKEYDHYGPAERAPNWHINKINEDLTYKAVGVINEHFAKETDDPLFLYFPTSAIHRPALPTFTKGKSQAGLRGDIVMELDWTVGQIVKALKANGAYENTLLIFTSDNGPRPGDPALWVDNYQGEDYAGEGLHEDYFDDHQPEYVNENGNKIWSKGWYTYGHNASGELLGFKSDSWDGGFKVPFIVHWPGNVKPGQVNDNTVSTVDLLATLAEVTGDQLADGQAEDSYSFLSNLKDINAPQVRESMILAGGASGAMVAFGEGWKYIEPSPKGMWPETYYPEGPSAFEDQLYQLSKDVSETQNHFEQNPEKVKELKALIERVKTQGGTEAGGSH